MANTYQEMVILIENMQHHMKIDIPEEDFEPGSECCIYKVPTCLREVNEKAFTPQLVSIGPIHHGNKNLAKMERQKLRYLKKFCERTSMETLIGFQSFIEENVKRLYRCYDEFAIETEFEASKSITMFLCMILKDAVLIVELFLRHSKKPELFLKPSKKPEDDFLLGREWLSRELSLDLILLENQLPFFVLEHLYNLAFGSSSRGKPSFLRLSCDYFFSNNWGGRWNCFDFDFRKDLTRNKEIKHFTDLARCVLIKNHPSNFIEKIDNVYNTTMLHEAGVDFKALQDTNSLLGVKFEKGELRIPSIHMGYRTEDFIRNLMALEQCHYPTKAYVCSYIQLLDYLVDTDKDVDLLEKKGIFLIDMDSNAAVADMINSLTVGVAEFSLCSTKSERI